METGLLSLAGLCALAALVELDDVYAGQFLLARPLVVGAVLGALCGEVQTGFQLGIWMEFILLDQLPVGGYVPPSGGMCAASAFMMAYLFKLPVPLSFLLGLAVGAVYSLLETRVRMWRNRWNAPLEKAVLERPGALNVFMVKSLLMQFAFGFALVLACVPLFAFGGEQLWRLLPEDVHNAVSLAYFAVPWIGMGSLVFSFYARSRAAVHA